MHIRIRRFAFYRIPAQKSARLGQIPTSAEMEEVNVTLIPFPRVTVNPSSFCTDCSKTQVETLQHEAPFFPQLCQMGLDLQGGNLQRFGAVGVNLGGDGDGGGVALGQPVKHLLFALQPVVQILL